MPAKRAADATEGATPLVEKQYPEINPMVPPRFVRHIPTGMTMNWSGLFRKRIHEFEPFYRKNTDDEQQHMVALRRYEMLQMMQGNVEGMFSHMVDPRAAAAASPFARSQVIDGDLTPGQ